MLVRSATFSIRAVRTPGVALLLPKGIDQARSRDSFPDQIPACSCGAASCEKANTWSRGRCDHFARSRYRIIFLDWRLSDGTGARLDLWRYRV